jgi:hypothetical protein
MTFAGGGRMGHFLGAAESAACVTEQKLELNSGSVAGAAGKGRYVGVPARQFMLYKILNVVLDIVTESLYIFILTSLLDLKQI